MPKLDIYNSLSTDPKVSLAEQKRLYQDLYTSRNKYLNNNSIETQFLMNFNNPKFTDEQKDLWEGKIHRDEGKNILNSFHYLNSSKRWNPDGI